MRDCSHGEGTVCSPVRAQEKQLGELTESSETELVEGTQVLPSAMCDRIFKARLSEIWGGLKKSDMTIEWKEALDKRSLEEWLSGILDGVPVDCRKMLSSLQPPTWDHQKLTLERPASIFEL